MIIARLSGNSGNVNGTDLDVEPVSIIRYDVVHYIGTSACREQATST